jgi:hypothetical protein
MEAQYDPAGHEAQPDDPVDASYCSQNTEIYNFVVIQKRKGMFLKFITSFPAPISSRRLTWPVAQLLHADAPALEYVPAEQETQKL